MRHTTTLQSTCSSKNGGAGCSRPVLSRGLCAAHYAKLNRGLDPNEPVRTYGQGVVEFNLRHPPSLHEKIEAAAKKSETSAYQFARALLLTWLESEEFRQMQLSDVGVGEGRQRDLTIKLPARSKEALESEARRRITTASILSRAIINSWFLLSPKKRPRINDEFLGAPKDRPEGVRRSHTSLLADPEIIRQAQDLGLSPEELIKQAAGLLKALKNKSGSK